MADHNPIKIKGIDHIVLRVRSVPRALEFYCGVLGCTKEREVETIGLIQLRAGMSLIDIVGIESELGLRGGAPAALTPAEGGRNVDHFAITICDFDEQAIVRYLRSQGIEPGEVARHYGAEGTGPAFCIQDPDGNIVELKGLSDPGTRLG